MPRITRIQQRLKGVVIGVYVPVHFAVASGHFRSALARKAVTRRGEPLPWYTYPAISYLSLLNFDGLRVLEFGGGQSTIWWADRAQRVTTVETDPEWFRYLQRVANRPNVELRAEPAQPTGSRFDIVIIDGGDRVHAAHLATEVVQPSGFIIFDNSESHWGVDESYPIIDLMNDRGFNRIDFHGYLPGVRRRGCTSLFFQDGCHLFRNLAPPALTNA